MDACSALANNLLPAHFYFGFDVFFAAAEAVKDVIVAPRILFCGFTPSDQVNSKARHSFSTISAMSLAFSYRDCITEVDEYLASASVSDDEPELALHWDQEALSQFVDAANNVDASVAMPDWLSQPRGSITPDSIVEDMMTLLATKAGGRFGRVLLATNSLVQFGQLCGMFAYIENDAFMLAAADATGISDGITLAKVFCVTEGSVSAAVPMEFPPLENQSRRLFS